MDDLAGILLGVAVAGGALWLLHRKQEQHGSDICDVQAAITGVPADACRAALGIVKDVAPVVGGTITGTIGGLSDLFGGSTKTCPPGFVLAKDSRKGAGIGGGAFGFTGSTCVQISQQPPPPSSPIGSSGSSRGPSGGVSVS